MRFTAFRLPGFFSRAALVFLGAVVIFLLGMVYGSRLAPCTAIALPVFDASNTGRIPGQFEHQAALMLGCNELVEHHSQLLVRIVEVLHKNIKLIGLVASQQQREQVAELLEKNHLPSDALHYFVWPVKAMWVQDYGPLFRVNGHSTVVNFTYDHPNRDLENLVPMAFASLFGLPIDNAELTMDGGNLLSNGRGVCASTTALIVDNQRRGYDIQRIGLQLKEHFHFDKWLYLKMLDGEPLSHVDMFLTFCAPNVAIVGSYDLSEDPVNSMILNDNAETIGNLTTKDGPIKVVRIPMGSHEDNIWRTYTNVIYGNGIVLVPQYPDVDPQTDRKAIEVYKAAMPNWQVVGIDASALIKQRGALHCISLNIPVLGQFPDSMRRRPRHRGPFSRSVRLRGPAPIC